MLDELTYYNNTAAAIRDSSTNRMHFESNGNYFPEKTALA
jgi:hypothetical protein